MSSPSPTNTALYRSRLPLAIGSARLAAARLQARIHHESKPGSGTDDSTRLRILAHVPTYPPATHSGSEMSLHSALKYLRSHGHEIRVLVPRSQQSATVDGIQVTFDDRPEIETSYRWSDVVFTQLNLHNRVARLAARYRRPFVRFMRMGGGFNRARNFGRPALIVYNARWLCDRYPHPSPRMVLHSPVYADDYRTERGDLITQINLSDRKGGPVLAEIARRLPDRQFLGVTGSWGGQVIEAASLPNVRIVEYTDDIRSIYNQTRILLFPSRYEPHPRTPLEACASGIPTLAHPAPGTVEAIDDAGIYCDRADPDAWVEAIRRLDDPDEYASASRAALARSAAKDPAQELHDFEATLTRMFGRPSGPRPTDLVPRP